MNHDRPRIAPVCPVFKAAAWRSIGHRAGVMHYRYKRP